MGLNPPLRCQKSALAVEQLESRLLLNITPVGDPLLVAVEGIDPSVGINAYGEIVVVWETADQVDQADRDVYYAQYDTDGQLVRSRRVTGGAVNPDVALNDAGQFAVAYDSVSRGGFQDAPILLSTGATKLYDGSNGQLINSASGLLGRGYFEPAVAIDPDGNALTVYDFYDFEPNGYTIMPGYYDDLSTDGIHALLVPANGSASIRKTFAEDQEHGEFASTYITYHDYPDVATDGAGQFLVTWSQSVYSYSGRTKQLQSRFYSWPGAGFGSTFNLETLSASEGIQSCLAGQGPGDFVAVWDNNITQKAALVSDSIASVTLPTGSGRMLRVAARDDGKFIVSYRLGASTYVQAYQANGTMLGDPGEIDAGNGNYEIAMSAGGEFVVAYEDNGCVYVQQYASLFGLEPDLVIEPFDAFAVPGETMDLAITSVNQGAASAVNPASVTIRLSDNRTITENDAIVGQITLPVLGAGQSYTEIVTIGVPADVGYYYLGAIVDANDSVAESNESNNLRIGKLGVGPYVYGTKYNDLNGNGQLDPGEPGMEGWTIYIDEDDNGLFDGDTRTDVLTFENPDDCWISSYSKYGSDDTRTFSLNVPAGAELTNDSVIADMAIGMSFTTYRSNLNATLTSPTGTTIELFDSMHDDINGASHTFVLRDDAAVVIDWGGPYNGIYLPIEAMSSLAGENPIGTWKLMVDNDSAAGGATLTQWSLIFETATAVTPEAHDVTDADGHYTIGPLNLGDYILTEVPQPDWIDSEPGPGFAYSIPIESNNDVFYAPFGSYQPGIFGTSFYDLNQNGLLDASETPLQGWTVYLDLNNNGILEKNGDQFTQAEPWQLTDKNGNYFFVDLDPGTYYVRQIISSLPGWERTTPNADVHIINYVEEESFIADFGYYNTLNSPPTIGSLLVSPDPVVQGNNVTLEANDVADIDGTVTQVAFYMDSDQDDLLNVSTDTWLGTDTRGADGWSWSGSTEGFTLGTTRYFALAQDDYGSPSDIATTTGICEAFSLEIGLDFTSLKYLDENDSEVTVSIKNGVAQLYFQGDLSDNLQYKGRTIFIVGCNTYLLNVKLNESNSMTDLSFKIEGGQDGQAILGGITGDSLGKLTGQNLDLGGDIELTGSLGVVMIDDILEGATITAGAADAKGSSFKVDDIADNVTFEIAGAVKSFQTSGFDSGLLKADSIGQLKINGNFGADITLDGADANPKVTLGAAQIAGNLTNSLWDITGEIGTLTVTGTVDNSTIRSTGNVKSITLGASNGSDFLVGINENVQRHAAEHSDFTNSSATLKSFNIKGIKGSSGRFFIDTNLSAGIFGKISLLNGDFDIGQTGIFAYDDPEGSREIQSVKYKDIVTKESWSWPLKGNVLPSVQDEIIHLL